MRWSPASIAVACLCLTPKPAVALPVFVSAEDTDGDATITLTIEDRFILNDDRSACSVEIYVGATQVRFTEGDVVTLWVEEDDFIGDEELWSTQHTITSEEAAAGEFTRIFDCTISFGTYDPGENFEIYAHAEIEKAACGFLCFYDRPRTSNIVILALEDDGLEEDDVESEANDLDATIVTDLISRDDDWFNIELAEDLALEVEIMFRARTGLVEAELLDDDGALLAELEGATSGGSINTGLLSAGVYTMRVWPANVANPNFYDIRVTSTTAECSPEDVETRDCGNCGSQTRTCENLTWTEFGECEGEGECGSGDEAVESCGRCGEAVSVCNAECVWEAGDCEGEGVCEAGATETEPCTGGTRTRECADDCQWGEFGECEAGGDGDVDGDVDGDADGDVDVDGDSDGDDDGYRDPADVAGDGCPCNVTGDRSGAANALVTLLRI